MFDRVTRLGAQGPDLFRFFLESVQDLSPRLCHRVFPYRFLELREAGVVFAPRILGENGRDVPASTLLGWRFFCS